MRLMPGSLQTCPSRWTRSQPSPVNGRSILSDDTPRHECKRDGGPAIFGLMQHDAWAGPGSGACSR
jgi:hypothetical protein